MAIVSDDLHIDVVLGLTQQTQVHSVVVVSCLLPDHTHTLIGPTKTFAIPPFFAFFNFLIFFSV